MGEKIKLTQEIVKETIWMNGEDFEFNGESYTLVEELESDMDDDGSTHPYIYIRTSDNKHFMITVVRVRYGYEDYCYESFANDCEMFEVEQKVKTIIYWGTV